MGQIFALIALVIELFALLSHQVVITDYLFWALVFTTVAVLVGGAYVSLPGRRV